jgi:HAE1 family hydrophobic/amphiphilic exporter-1
LESIARCREEGDGVVAGAIRGTREVAAPVISSTLTSVAVFFPMVFVEGIAGQAFGDLGVAVVVSQFAALAVALFFVPMLASRTRRAAPEATGEGTSSWRFAAWAALRHDAAALRRWMRGPVRFVLGLLAFPYLALRFVLSALFEGVGKLLLGIVALVSWLGRKVKALFGRASAVVSRRRPRRLGRDGRIGMGRAKAAYEGRVRWGVHHPGPVLATTVVLMGLTWALGTRLDSELLPEVHQGELTFEVALPVGTPLEKSEAILAPVERAILEEKEHIRAMILTVGFDPAESQRADEGEHTARFKLLLTASDPRVEAQVIERMRTRLAQVPDLEARVTRPVLFSSRTPIEVEVHGDDLPRLKALSERVRETMAALPELADVEATLKSGAPEVQVIYNRDLLARYGLNVRQVAELVRNQVRGFEATRFNRRDRRVPIVVRLAESDRETVDDVRELVVNPQGEPPISLAAVAAVTLGEGPSEVRRVDSRRVSLVRANIKEGSLGSAAEAIERALSARIEWPTDMTYLVAGQNQEWERSRASLWLALGLSIFLVYVIMAAQFESLLHPFIILFSIPLAFFGTVATLWVMGISLSVVVFLGMIMLAGIVVNNAIVLIDYINVLRRRGVPRDLAIVTAGTVRLRPILMTTATTVLGLVPMALGIGDGAEIRTPMAIAVISGLTSSTVLTLFLIPSIYALFDRMKDRLLGAMPADTPADIPTTAPQGDFRGTGEAVPS